MNSIKTFWSPELKKERALRKDEATKIAVWKEQYRVVQDETQVGCLHQRAVLSCCTESELSYKKAQIEKVKCNILFGIGLISPSLKPIQDLDFL